MKKLISIILIIALLIVSVVAYASDYSSMTDEKLKEEFDSIRNELIVRGLKAENKTVILDEKGFQIYINGDISVDKEYEWADNKCLFLPVVVVNSTSQNLNMLVENCSVNGWTESGNKDTGVVPAGKKAKGYLIFSLNDSEVESISDFTEVEFSLRVYDDSTWKDLIITKPITLYGNK